MNTSSTTPPSTKNKGSSSTILLILGVCFVIFSLGILGIYYEEHKTLIPNSWIYLTMFAGGLGLIIVNVKRFQQEKQQNK